MEINKGLSMEYIDEKTGVKVQVVAARGRAISFKTSKWKPRLNVSDKDLKALKKTIQASEKDIAKK